MVKPKLLMLEFNELCPTLLDRWMAAGELPNFKRFYDDSEVFTTVADAEPPALEPWVQWYSMHTGLSYAQHGVLRLTDGPRSRHPDIWEVLRGAGLKTVNFCGMNAKGFSQRGSIFLPDPWCTSERAYPDELNKFHEFVSAMVQEYSNRQWSMRPSTVVRFLGYVATHGLRPTTVLDILKLLYEEKRRNSFLTWRQPVVLDWMQRDLFFHYFYKLKPDFATFFLNSTAHFQHAYWRHMDPEAFRFRPPANEIQQFEGAILYGYKNMDRLIEDFFALEREGVTLALATALSQQPFLKYESIGGQHFYRPRNSQGFFRSLGVKAAAVQPTMTHQYMLRFDSPVEAETASAVLDSLRCDGQPAMLVERKDERSIFTGCVIRTLLSPDATLEWTVGRDVRSVKFLDAFYMIEEIKSGMHHPDGCLWFKTGRHTVHEQKVSVLNVFPTILDYFGLAYRPSDRHSFRYSSLMIGKHGRPAQVA